MLSHETEKPSSFSTHSVESQKVELGCKPEKSGSLLDLYSITQTSSSERSDASYATCVNHAPFMVYPKETPTGKSWHITQGCCNSWLCPRCGQIRAKQEYWRMVNGAESLSKADYDLFMMTLTCRGKEMPLSQSESDYGLWTNRINTAIRMKAKRAGLPFHFVAVTERQKRGHPHSHYITTFKPPDAVPVCRVSWRTDSTGRLTLKNTDGSSLWSDWLIERAQSAGVGRQVDLSVIRSAAAASRYAAKYLFKDAVFTEWPKSWKRIRYSQNWPKDETFKPNPDAFAVVKEKDWKRVENLKQIVRADDFMTAELARQRVANVVYPC